MDDEETRLLRAYGSRKDLPIHLASDQPETCPMCGTRTHWVQQTPERQIHECPNPVCKYAYAVEEE